MRKMWFVFIAGIVLFIVAMGIEGNFLRTGNFTMAGIASWLFLIALIFIIVPPAKALKDWWQKPHY